jgi:transcriptional regulator with XRE-family HTH domain
MAKPVDEEEPPEAQALYAYVGSRVRAERELAKLSQKDLASLTDMRQPYIFEIERIGVNLSLKSLLRLATALGVSPRDFFPGQPGQADLETQNQGFREKVGAILAIMQSVDPLRGQLADLLDAGQTRDQSG